MVKIIVSGICGRMGRKIASLAMADPEIELAGGVEASACSMVGGDIGAVLETGPVGIKVEPDLRKAIKKADCVVEFTEPIATCEHVEVAKANRKAMVIGTTGLNDKQMEIMEDASKTIPIVFSPNMSVGVNLLFKLVRDASRTLGKGYAVEVEEVHHVHKKDAPSGTAIRIAEIIKANKKDLAGQLDISSRREGEVVGDHRVRFVHKYETLELFHSARARDVFAEGALLASKFVAKKKPGLYTMADVLGFKDRS